MFTSPFFRRLFVPYLLLVCGAIATDLSGRDPPADLDARIDRLGASTGLRITIMRDDGVVVADSEADLAATENHKARPEFVQAANTGEGISDRTSGTVGTDLLYVAQRLQDSAGAAVQDARGRAYFTRTAVHIDELRQNLRALYGALTLAGVACILMAGAICYGFARRMAQPISDLTTFADALSRGDLHRRTSR